MKRVLITGGARRIGGAIASACAAAGAEVIIHCFRSLREAEQLAAALPGSGHRIIQADLAEPDAAELIFSRLDRPVDVLINNASMYEPFAGAENENDELVRRYFQVNAFSPVSLMRLFAAQPGLDSGAIVNILDQEVLGTVPERGAYSRSRRMLHDATLEYAKTLAPRNIRVNGIAPGPVLPPAWCPGSCMAKVLQSVPLNRPVDLQDLVSAVLFMIENKSVTGAVLAVDCGQHLR